MWTSSLCCDADSGLLVCVSAALLTIPSPGSAATFFDGKQRSGAPDDNGHGTHVAGIAAAVGNNNMGVSGVAQAADLWACRFMDSQGNGYLSDATECIKWCTKCACCLRGCLAMRALWIRVL